MSKLRFDIKDSKRFFNRELSWISFNWRVLEEADNGSIPILERVRFLAISASNLDEFYSVRVAGLREMVKENISFPSADGLSPTQQLSLIEKEARLLIDHQQKVWRKLLLNLRSSNIAILEVHDLSKQDYKFLQNVFFEQVFPVLTPLAIDPAHPFPFIPSGGFALALSLRRKSDGFALEALLPVPGQISRFYRIDDGPKGLIRFLPLERMLEQFIDKLFPGYDVIGKSAFRILRDSDLELEEEAEDLVREFETALKRRRRGDVIRMKVTADTSNDLLNIISRSLGVLPEEVIKVDGMVGMADLSELVLTELPKLLWPPFTSRVPERVEDHNGDIFSAIRQKDLLLHHPYESFDIVVRFLQQAATDQNVLSIRQTLYRTSNDSPIVRALCEAAEEGKSVTALIELKARFDEAANIRQSRTLERAGVQVIYGFIDWKTHAKLSTVVRREGSKLVTYSHFGTGNYHPITAKFYTDLSLFTSDPALGRDATKVFNYVSGYVEPEALENLRISPLNLKETLIENFNREIKSAADGKSAMVWVKVNSLIDPEIIDLLYRASCAGVKIDLVVRGICGVRPGIKSLSENIRVKSVIGRFLEHSRIVCFGNGAPLPSSQAKVYISSADWMGRNLNRRVESLVEIRNETVHAQILEQIMAANLSDTAHSWVLMADGSYQRHEDHTSTERFSCHQFFMENPSMSGRGRAGLQDVPRLMHSNG
ncbi:MAG: RNA degradosome polyphosphate kinase [Rhodobacteraceae bacterium]|nr:MAG: RNA degradosome polyphosphate kinase [Paracoccaceae bacterium]